MFRLKKTYKSIVRQVRWIGRCSLVTLVTTALLFSSMGMQFMLVGATGANQHNMSMVNMDSSHSMSGIDMSDSWCPICGKCMSMSQGQCSCPICTMQNSAVGNNISLNKDNTTNSSSCNMAASPCSSLVQWKVMMTNLGWDIPAAVYAHPSLKQTPYLLVCGNTNVVENLSISIDPPPPRLTISS